MPDTAPARSRSVSECLLSRAPHRVPALRSLTFRQCNSALGTTLLALRKHDATVGTAQSVRFDREERGDDEEDYPSSPAPQPSESPCWRRHVPLRQQVVRTGPSELPQAHGIVVNRGVRISREGERGELFITEGLDKIIVHDVDHPAPPGPSRGHLQPT